MEHRCTRGESQTAGVCKRAVSPICGCTRGNAFRRGGYRSCGPHARAAACCGIRAPVFLAICIASATAFVPHAQSTAQKWCALPRLRAASCECKVAAGGAVILNHARSHSAAPGGVRSLQGVVLPAAMVPVVAGAIGGAIGVGAAFPFDTLKTKAQIYERSFPPVAFEEGLVRGNDAVVRGEPMGMLAIARRVVETDGISGFYGGVSTMMVGQAFIKSLAFACNDWAMTWQGVNKDTATLTQLCAAALLSGFVTSFLVNPFERVKILCQANEVGVYNNGLDCALEIIRTDGVDGFLTRGLGPTLARETPSYGIYFVLYALLMDTRLADLGLLAPMVCGALAGCGCWVPVYPIDVVKTQIQNTQGQEKAPSAWQAANDLYAVGGLGMFWDGLESKVLRAATNHAVTFFVYDYVVQLLAPLSG